MGFQRVLKLIVLVGLGSVMGPGLVSAFTNGTNDGHPINANQTPGAVLDYVDTQYQGLVRNPDKSIDKMALGPGWRRPDMGRSDSELIEIVSKFGLHNLMEAYRIGPSPHREEKDTDEVVSWLQSKETSIIFNAAEMAVSESDLPVLTEEADKDSVAFVILAGNPRWSDNVQVMGLLVAKLNQRDPVALLAAATNPNPDVQAKLNEVLQQMLVNPPARFWAGATKESYEAVDTMMTQQLGSRKITWKDKFPAWAALKVAFFNDKSDPLIDKETLYQMTTAKIAWEFRGPTNLFAEEPLRKGVQILIPKAAGMVDGIAVTDLGVDYDFLAAGTGDAKALRELLQAYVQVEKSNAVAASPGGDIPSITLNGNQVKDAKKLADYAALIRKQIDFHGSDTFTLTDVVNSLDSAVYDNATGKWAMTVNSKVQAAAAAASATVQPLSDSAVQDYINQWTLERQPLPTTDQGRPIDSTRTPDAVLQFVDREVQLRARIPGATSHFNSQTGRLNETPLVLKEELGNALVPIVAGFGMENLVAAYVRGVAPLAKEGDSSVVSEQLKNYEIKIIRGAISSAATEDNISDLADLAKSDPMRANILQEFATDQKTITELDSLDLSSISNASRSHNPALRNKVVQIAANLLSDPDSAQMKKYRSKIDEMMEDCVGNPDNPCRQLFPAWAAIKAGDAKSKQEYLRTVRNLGMEFAGRTENFADESLCNGTKVLLAAVDGDNDYVVPREFLEAGMGDRAAFTTLFKTYGDLKQREADKESPLGM